MFGKPSSPNKRAERPHPEPAVSEAPAKPDLFANVQFAFVQNGLPERDVRQALTVLRRERTEWDTEPRKGYQHHALKLFLSRSSSPSPTLLGHTKTVADVVDVT